MTLSAKTGTVNEPYLEWEVRDDDLSDDPLDVVAYATFTHDRSGTQKRSTMYSDGAGVWKFRFTGTQPGIWSLRTAGPGDLGGRTSRVVVEPSTDERKGFFTTDGAAWVWSGTGKEHVPQLAMSRDLSAYWTGKAVDEDAIDEEIQEFVTETGFTGFHKSSIAAQWFDVENDSGDTRTVGPDATPDAAAFDVLEAFLLRAYEAGVSTHLWLWGSDAHRVGWPARSGPDGIGGEFGRAALRLYRYLAARLGPIPGWSMGYGYDLSRWTNPAHLQEWYDYLKRHLGGWAHPLGARADRGDSRSDDRVTLGELREGPSAVYWTGGDYVGLYHYRVPYQRYRETLAFGEELGLPVLQEDRFRVRESDQFSVKDYTPALTRRGLWHSMLAGGVGNIWGNLMPDRDHGGSRPYDNGARGSIQGVGFTVDVKDQIDAWRTFWFEEGRARPTYRTANGLTNDEPGPISWATSPNSGPISVALAATDRCHYVFYREDTREIRMDLRDMRGVRLGVAVNAETGYREDLSDLEPRLYESYELEDRADWAVAVGSFES